MPIENCISVRHTSWKHQCTGFVITAITDIPCHLYMRWTCVKPQIHSKPIALRGIYLHSEIYFCFVATHNNEQEEAGDTLIHTFVKLDWPVCETRWFHFWGRVDGINSPSTSAIWRLHFNIKISEMLGTPSNRTIGVRSGDWNTSHDSPVGVIHDWYGDPHYYITPGAEGTASKFIYRAFISFDTTHLSTTRDIVGAQLKLFTTFAKCTLTTAAPNICITKGVQHDPVNALNYGDQLPYTQIGGQTDIRDFVLDEYNTIEFNETGLGWINRGGITKLCIRGDVDILETYAPYGVNIVAFTSRQGGEAKAPQLITCQEPD